VPFERTQAHRLYEQARFDEANRAFAALLGLGGGDGSPPAATAAAGLTSAGYGALQLAPYRREYGE
jgi:hypothetical protein